ncbi:glycosyltransferase family 4 protein [Shewanella psychrotolerans]|uniref:glycosyltransferase family 4 protein n=1 Tax=Shewanella psychrotolerans TaxID=2864206 RepID=UPI001C65B024|nr:glycosyltransferase family 4 protein [Shewanella psychrotolerans]QYK00271.1 glycosyltransferase family 4 protein [Shewanella psychrotolerans]
MRILYLHQYFATPSSNAGTRSYEMAKRLVAKGHDVTFVTSSAYLSTESAFAEGWNFLELEGIKLHVLHLPYSNRDSFIKRIFKFLQFSLLSTFKSLTVKADVVLATSTPLTIAIPGLVYSKLKRKPMVFEVRDLWPELPIAVGAIKNRFVIKFAQWFEKYTYHNSKRLIGLSPGMCDGITRHGVAKEHVFLATNSCDTTLFDVDKSLGERYKQEKLPFLKGRKLVVYTGTFGLINKVGYLVELASKMREIDNNICFVAIGDGMEKQAIIEKAKLAGVFEKNLFFLDPVPKTEIVSLLSAADLSMSLFGDVEQMWHNSANKLFDALASSTPIAINYGGWQKDFIEEYKCGLILDAKNHDNSALNLSNFLLNDTSYETAVTNCHYLAYNKFSRDIMADRVETALMEAVND